MSEEPVKKQHNLNSRWVWLGVAIIGTIMIWIIIVFVIHRSLDQSPTYTNVGAAIIEGTPFTGITSVNPPRDLQDFTLTRQDGKPFSLSMLRGRMALLYFGYTHCPDVCPLTLAGFKQIKQSLDSNADQVAFVFISIDSKRDTPQVMSTYLASFDSSFIGLTGDEAILRKIAPDYDLTFEISPMSGTPMSGTPMSGSSMQGYFYDHTSNMYLVGREGRLVAVYTNGIAIDDIAADIRKNLQLNLQ